MRFGSYYQYPFTCQQLFEWNHSLKTSNRTIIECERDGDIFIQKWVFFN